MRFPEAARSHVPYLLEHVREVRLVAEPRQAGDRGKRLVGRCQQFGCAPDPRLAKQLLERAPCVLSLEPRQLARLHAGMASRIRQSHGEMKIAAHVG